MPALLSLLLALVPAALANPDYDAGVEALKVKDTARAKASFESCLKSEPANTECHWELGWVYWVENRWPEVVKQWEQVQKTDPSRKGLADGLAQARDNVALEGMLAKGRAAAAKTYTSHASGAAADSRTPVTPKR